MKSIKELTGREIIDEAMQAVPEYLADIRSTGLFDLDACVRREERRIQRLYKKNCGIRDHMPVSKQDIQAMDALCAHFEPQLRELTAEIQRKYLKGRKLSKINETWAKAIIPEPFKRAGIPVKVIGQRYRAKVVATLPGGTPVRFYVRYKELGKEGLLDDLLTAILDLKDALGRLGYGAVVGRE